MWWWCKHVFCLLSHSEVSHISFSLSWPLGFSGTCPSDLCCRLDPAETRLKAIAASAAAGLTWNRFWQGRSLSSSFFQAKTHCPLLAFEKVHEVWTDSHGCTSAALIEQVIFAFDPVKLTEPGFDKVFYPISDPAGSLAAKHGMET